MVTGGLMLPAAVAGLGRPSGPTMPVTAWYAGLTLVTLGLAYLGRGLRRPR